MSNGSLKNINFKGVSKMLNLFWGNQLKTMYNNKYQTSSLML